MKEKNEAAITMAKLSHERFKHLSEERLGQYFSLIRRGKKAEAKLLISDARYVDDMRT